MYVIDKRRIMIVLSSIIIAVMVVSINFNEVKKTVMTAASPVSSKVIILDAGHGYPDKRR